MKLISVDYSNSWCDKNIIDIDPFEWLGYFKNAKYVLTSTFHGTIFSLKYKSRLLREKMSKLSQFQTFQKSNTSMVRHRQ